MTEVPHALNISILSALPEYEETRQVLLQAIHTSGRKADASWLSPIEIRSFTAKITRWRHHRPDPAEDYVDEL